MKKRAIRSMGKISVDHRIVTRNASGEIISDTPAPSFAEGKPMFDAACLSVERGHVVTLQHGARIIFKAQG